MAGIGRDCRRGRDGNGAARHVGEDRYGLARKGTAGRGPSARVGSRKLGLACRQGRAGKDWGVGMDRRGQ